jgi:hypothetical protein
MLLGLEYLEEPLLEFGEGDYATPKQGLTTAGPFDLRFGSAHKSEVRVGLVGTRAAVDGTRAFLARMLDNIPSGNRNARLFPDFPGFRTVFHADLVYDSHFDALLGDEAVDRALERRPQDAFEAAADLWADAVARLAERDVAPDLVICCIPRKVLSRCRRIETKVSPETRKALRRRQRELETGQVSLVDLNPSAWSIETVGDPDPEMLLVRDFRRTLKARAMTARLPIQIATENLWLDGQRNEDPASRAWNASVALYYKGGGIPWRVRPRIDGSCFVGISFHHLRTTHRDVVYSSLAQAFSSEGDGFALRGDALPWESTTKQTRLAREHAEDLATRVLNAYRDRAGRDPLRIVIHKTSRFTEDERAGFAAALDTVPVVELITLRSSDLRLVRRGTYPPHRGTYCTVGDTSHVFTSGYISDYRTYPGPHVPVPLEIVSDPNVDPSGAAQDILALTKMNWNSAKSFMAFPITLNFAQRVGGIMSEVPSDLEPHPSLRFYM